MKHSIVLIVVLFLNFSLEAQHRQLPVENFNKKTRKELFDLFELYNLKIANAPKDASTYFKRGWLKYYLADTSNALIDIQNAITLDPKNAYYRYARVYIIIDKNDYQAVINECDSALKYDKTFVDVLVLRGSALDQLKRPVEARENYNRAIQIDSTYEDTYLQYISSYALTNEFDKAEALILKVLKLNPISKDGLKCKAKMYMYYKKFNNVIEVADELIKVKGSVTDAYILKAAAYDSLKNQPKVCECMYNLILSGYEDGYQYIMNKCPKEQEIRVIKNHTLQLKALELQEQRNFEESMAFFNDAIKVMPDSGLTYYNRGKLKRKMENHKDAIEDYLIAIKKSPYIAIAYVAAGVSYTFLNDVDNAKKYYLKCMQVDPLNEMAYHNFADILRGTDNYKEAVYYYKYAIDIKPDYTKAYFGLGECYAKLGMSAEACEAFRMAEKLGEIKAISQRLWHCK